MVFGKRGQGTQGIASILIIAVLGWFLLTQTGLLGGGTAPSVSGGGAAPTVSDFCADSSVTMTLGPVKAWRAPTRSMSNEYHRYYEGGIDQGLFADGSTRSVRVKKNGGNEKNTVTVFYAENSTDYFAAEAKDIKVPCGAFTTASMDNGRHVLGNNSQDITFDIFNEDDRLKNAITNNQSYTTGDQVIFEFKLRGTQDEVWSPYGEVIVVVDYNESEFDGGKFALGGFPTTSIPVVHSLQTTDFKSRAWKVPGGPNPSTTSSGRWELFTDLVTQADSSVNPGGANTRDHLNVTVYCQDWFQDPDETVQKFGAEDSRGTSTCFASQSTTITYT